MQLHPAEKPRILLVGGGPFQLEVLRAARRVGEVAVVDGSPHAPGLALADYPRVVDIADCAAVVEVARALRVSGVLTAASDVAVPAVSAVVRALGLPGSPPDVALRCRDKLACFQALQAHGHAVPHTYAVADEPQAERAALALGGYPVIVKPRTGGGGRGVVLVRSREELPGALACARRAYGTGELGVLVQEYIGGRSVGVEAFFSGGELIEAFVLDDQFEPGYISPAGHALPPTLEPAVETSVIAAVAAFGRSLGLCDGPANFDLRQVDGRTVMLEVNPRLGGNSITDLVRAAYGVDLAEASVAAAIGGEPRHSLRRRSCVPTAARLILKHAHGVARLEEPVSSFLDHPDVLSLDVLVSDGQLAHVRVDEWTILGRVMVRAADSGGAAGLAERVAGEAAERIALL
ncbi:MAG: ATP-grasp domain-containing protein [Polyangiales bacterium]